VKILEDLNIQWIRAEMVRVRALLELDYFLIIPKDSRTLNMMVDTGTVTQVDTVTPWTNGETTRVDTVLIPSNQQIILVVLGITDNHMLIPQGQVGGGIAVLEEDPQTNPKFALVMWAEDISIGMVDGTTQVPVLGQGLVDKETILQT
jgi:hypothetical protein